MASITYSKSTTLEARENFTSSEIVSRTVPPGPLLFQSASPHPAPRAELRPDCYLKHFVLSHQRRKSSPGRDANVASTSTARFHQELVRRNETLCDVSHQS